MNSERGDSITDRIEIPPSGAHPARIDEWAKARKSYIRNFLPSMVGR